MSTKNKLFFQNTVIAGSGPCRLLPAPATASRTQGLPPGPARGAGAVGRGTEVLSPGLISPSSCITAAKFRRFTRNYHQQPSAPGLSEQVNDLSPGLCPRVTTITAGSASSQRSLPPRGRTRVSSSQPPPKATRDPSTPTPQVLCPSTAPGQPPRRALPPPPPPRCDHPSVGYWENIEHSASTPPPAPGLGRRPRTRWEQTAQMSRAARQAPAAAARGSCPVSKAIPKPRVQGVPGCLQARQQPQQNPSGLVYLEGYFKPLLK